MPEKDVKKLLIKTYDEAEIPITTQRRKSNIQLACHGK